MWGNRASKLGTPVKHLARPRRAHLDVEDGAASPGAVLPAAGLPVEALVPRQHGGQRLDLLVSYESEQGPSPCLAFTGRILCTLSTSPGSV